MDMTHSKQQQNIALGYRHLLACTDLLSHLAEVAQMPLQSQKLQGLLSRAADGSLESEYEQFVTTVTEVLTTVSHDLELQMDVSGEIVRRQQNEYQKIAEARKQVGERLASTSHAELAAQHGELTRSLERALHTSRPELKRYQLLVDLSSEVAWCSGGISAAMNSIASGSALDEVPYPVRAVPPLKEFEQWCDSLGLIMEVSAQEFPELAPRLASAIERLRVPQATITFGGRFKSGKSSLLNAAIRRPLLPTYDLPWTGANCHLMNGECDSAQLVLKTETREIPCETASLQQAISLQGGHDGTDRTAHVNRLILRLKSFPGGKAVQWIDPPGMFDRPEMTERAWDAANQADILIWVFNSQQFLGEAEADALAQFIAQRGPGSVIFVENARLREDQPDPWQYHMQQISEVNHGKLKHLAEEMGLSADQMPQYLVASAAKVLEHGFGYGAAPLRRLLEKLTGPTCPLVFRARLQWLLLELQPMLDAARKRHQQVVQENARRQKVLQANLERVKNNAAKYFSGVREVVSKFCIRFETAAVRIGNEIAASITDSLLRDGSYERSIQYQLAEASQQFADDAIRELQEIAKCNSISPLSAADQDAVKLAMYPNRVSIVVAEHNAGGGGMAAGAAAGAAAGMWLFGFGAIPGAIAGGLVGLVGSESAAKKKNIEETKANIVSAALAAASSMRTDQAAIIHTITRNSAPVMSDATPPEVDRSREELVEALCGSLEAAIVRSNDWINRRAI